MAKVKKAKEAKVINRESIFADAKSELGVLSAKYKALALSQSGGSAQRLNKASIDLGRLAKLFV